MKNIRDFKFTSFSFYLDSFSEKSIEFLLVMTMKLVLFLAVSGKELVIFSVLLFVISE